MKPSMRARASTRCGSKQVAMPDENRTTGSGRQDSTAVESFVKLGLGALSIAGAGAAVFGYEFLSPNVLYEPSPIVNAGKPDRYPHGFGDARSCNSGIYIVHAPEGFYALSARSARTWVV